ncbi:MAG: hypothetical protein C4309_03900 [Chloroflexota bacterium]
MTVDAESKFATFQANGMNFFRVWLSGSSVVGAAWMPWTSHHVGAQGYLPYTSLTTEVAYGGNDFSMKLDSTNPCMFQGSYNRTISVRPNTTYRIRARVRTSGITGPAQAGYPYGFVVKLGDWLGTDCDKPWTGTAVTAYRNGTADWAIVSGSYTTGAGQYFLPNLYLARVNATGGAAYIDEVWVEEDLGSGRYGPNLVSKSRMNPHTYFDQPVSWDWDYILDRAAAYGVYLKLVVLEKDDWTYTHILPDGTVTPNGDTNNFYAAPNTKVRWLHQAYWRYLAARWGYSTAVHSWELLNEGDPFNGNHHNQAQAFGAYMHTNEPSRHLITTSFWHSFPVVQFWANPAYPDVDYADLHAYISTGGGIYDFWGNGVSAPLAFETRSQYVYGGTGVSVRIPGSSQFSSNSERAIAIRGQGEWRISIRMKAEGFTGACPAGDPASLAGPRLKWLLDGGTYWGGTENVVPPNASGTTWRCSAPAGTYDWTEYRSDQLPGGGPSPAAARLIINDTRPHELRINFENPFGTGGQAWIDYIVITNPTGEVLQINGDFDLTRLDDDTAWFTAARSLREGGRAASGAGKPLVRGETGIDYPDNQVELPELAQDTQGVWLHNLIWGQINPGGMSELYWWINNIRQYNLYYHFKAFSRFMAGIPLSNGRYQDTRAAVSDSRLRAWGQIDPASRWAHLWIANSLHTWRNVVNGTPIPPLSGTVTVPGLTSGSYQVVWWDTLTGTPTLTQTLTAGAGADIACAADQRHRRAHYAGDRQRHCDAYSDTDEHTYVAYRYAHTHQHACATHCHAHADEYTCPAHGDSNADEYICAIDQHAHPDSHIYSAPSSRQALWHPQRGRAVVGQRQHDRPTDG